LELHGALEALSDTVGLPAQFNVSTIIPTEIAQRSLLSVFGDTITPGFLPDNSKLVNRKILV
jgi:hypothetical protein